MRFRSTSGGSLRRTGRLAKSCGCDESTAPQPRCAGRSITSGKPSPQVQMRCCRTRCLRDSSAHSISRKFKIQIFWVFWSESIHHAPKTCLPSPNDVVSRDFPKGGYLLGLGCKSTHPLEAIAKSIGKRIDAKSFCSEVAHNSRRGFKRRACPRD